MVLPWYFSIRWVRENRLLRVRVFIYPRPIKSIYGTLPCLLLNLSYFKGLTSIRDFQDWCQPLEVSKKQANKHSRGVSDTSYFILSAFLMLSFFSRLNNLFWKSTFKTTLIPSPSTFLHIEVFSSIPLILWVSCNIRIKSGTCGYGNKNAKYLLLIFSMTW